MASVWGGGGVETSVSDLDSIRSVDPDSESGSGSRRAKMTHKIAKKLKELRVLKYECSLLRAETVAWTSLMEGLGINKL
jgi:hypothetical protein